MFFIDCLLFSFIVSVIVIVFCSGIATSSKNPRKYLKDNQLKNNKYRAIADYISGMTDRFAIDLFNKIK